MDRSQHLNEHIAGEAAEWFVRLQDSRETESARGEFVDWLMRSPTHVEEFLGIARTWGETGAVDCDEYSVEALTAAALDQGRGAPENVVSLTSGLKTDVTAAMSSSRSPWSMRFRLVTLATAAAIAVVTVGVLGWIAFDLWLNPSHIRTAIGEQRSVTLADGSLVDVNTRSEIRIDLNGLERRVRLLHGEARFKVAKDPARPFVVITPQATVRALGTVFNVQSQSERTAVAVLEGSVEVQQTVQPSAVSSTNIRAVAPHAYRSGARHPISTPDSGTDRLELKAGQEAAVTSLGEIIPDAGPPIERVAAWPQRRLVFHAEPLTDVVVEFNRYHDRPIRIEDSSLAALRISGSFDSGDPHSLIQYLEQFEDVRVEEDASAIRLRVVTQ